MNYKELNIDPEEIEEEDFDLTLNNEPTGERVYLDDLDTSFPWYKRMWWKISNLLYTWYDIENGIKSIMRWRNIVWRDRTWGYSNIIEILIFKLKMDREAFLRRNITTSTNEICGQMLEVITLLEKWSTYDYFEEYKKKHDEKWGEDKLYLLELNNGASEMRSDRDDRLTEDQKRIEKAEYFELLEQSEREKKHDLDVAFQIITQNIESWWD